MTGDDKKKWSLLVLTSLFFLYWLFARYLEGIDLHLSPPQFWLRLLSIFPLFNIFSGPTLFAFEMFSPRVLRHLIPVLVGWWLARQATFELLVNLYDLPDMKAAGEMLGRLQAGQVVPWPRIGIQRTQFAEQRQAEPLLRIGGPGQVLVAASDAIVTERNGRFYRVLGTGRYYLGRFESVRAVLDLRPQERAATNIPLITKDGINLSTSLSVTFAIAKGGHAPSKARPYPYDETAVRLAAYAETGQDDGSVSGWESAALNTTIGQLKSAVAKFRLDELIYPNRPSADPHQTVQSEMERKARDAAARFGVEIISTRLGRLELPEIVTDQRIKVWQTTWQKQELINRADGTAAALEETEMARAEGEAAIILAIVEGVQRARRDGNTNASREIVALRVVETLEKMARQTQHLSAEPIPGVVSQLQSLHRRLLTTSPSEQPTVVQPNTPSQLK
jgi:hypothetical protein